VAAVWEEVRAKSWGLEAGQPDFSKNTGTTGGARDGFLKHFSLYSSSPPTCAQTEPDLSTDTRAFSFLLALAHQHLVMVERGCTSLAQSSRISVYLGSAIRQKIPPSARGLQHKTTWHILCAQPGAITGILDGSHRASL